MATENGADAVVSGGTFGSIPAHDLNGRNKFTLTCTHCSSKILAPHNGEYVKEERKLPKMTQQKNSPQIETDTIEEWFLVENMFTFENVGVSYVVDNIKYLTCADCEYGPIGWMDLSSHKSYVAIPRVRQDIQTSSAASS